MERKSWDGGSGVGSAVRVVRTSFVAKPFRAFAREVLAEPASCPGMEWIRNSNERKIGAAILILLSAIHRDLIEHLIRAQKMQFRRPLRRSLRAQFSGLPIPAMEPFFAL